MTTFDALSANKLRADLDSAIIGRDIVVLDQTTSTNDSVLERAPPMTPEGLVVFAEHQTAGRGQRNNSWEAATGKGLWFSILLRPKIDIGADVNSAYDAATARRHGRLVTALRRRSQFAF